MAFIKSITQTDFSTMLKTFFSIALFVLTDKMADFFLHVKDLAYEQRPDYQALRTLLSAGGRRAGGGLDLSRPPGELAGASRTRGPDRSKVRNQEIT